MAIAVIGLVALMQGKSEAAIAACDRVIALAPEEPDPFVRCAALGHCCAIFSVCGAFDRLEDLERQAMKLAEQLDNRYLLTHLSNSNTAGIHVTDPDGAVAYLQRVYALNNEIGMYSINTIHRDVPRASRASLGRQCRRGALGDASPSTWPSTTRPATSIR